MTQTASMCNTVHVTNKQTMIQTDEHYGQPVVFKMTTCNRDKLIQLDTYGTIKDVLRNTYLKPVSYVSNNAGCYS